MADGRLISSRTDRAVKIAQGMAILLIVLFHANVLLFREGLSFPGSGTALAILSPALLSLFFFAAGRSFGQRKRSSLHKHVVNRTDGYLWILIIWNVIYVSSSNLYIYIRSTSLETFTRYLDTTLSSIRPQDIIKFFILPSNVTWFVYCIFLYIVATYWARTINKVTALLVLATFFDALAWSFNKTELYINFQYFEIFLVGCLYGDALLRWLDRSHPVSRLFLVIVYMGASYGAFVWLPKDIPVVSTIIRIAGLLSMICVGLSIRGLVITRNLSIVANYMLPIYLMHSLLLYLFVSILHVTTLKTSSSLVLALSTPVIGFACVLVCIAIFKWAKISNLLIFRPKWFRPAAFLDKLTLSRR